MVTDIALISMAAMFLLASLHHALIWFHNAAEREHLWFGIATVAAAGAAAAQRPETAASAASAETFLSFFLIAWLLAITWFVIEYAAGDRRRRQIAWVATTAPAAIALVGLVSGAGGWFAASGLPQVLGILTLAIALCLSLEGAVRLYRASKRSHAMVLGAIAVTLILIAGRSAWSLGPVPDVGWLASFLVVVLLVLHELTRVVADSKFAAQRQGHELAHASRLSIVGELTATIAHEINQPLGAILSNADAGEILLEDADPPLDEIRKILTDIRRDGLRASEVILHLRRLVKKRALELEKLDANLVVADVISLFAAESHRRRIAIGSVLSPEPQHVSGDRALLEQVLINLVLNAMDAVESLPPADASRRLRIAIELGVATTSHGEVEIWIRDVGPGIPPEHLRHLFDSFYTSKPHGMGLGLSISRSIVEAHGGRIQCENNADAGARFQITLPPFSDNAG